jgi:hypothetical protein
MNVPRKYGLLRAIGTILKVLAWIILVVGIVAAIAGLFSLGRSTGLTRFVALTGVIGAPLLSIIWFIQLYAFGSVLSLLIDIEESTRAMAAEPGS